MKSEDTSRANWRDPQVFNRFIELHLKEARPNNYSGGSLKKECWERIRVTLKEENKGDFAQRQLKNEWDYLKQKYTIWTKLISITGNSHYDSDTNTINWSSEQWDEYIKENPKAKQFRFKPLEYPNEMEALFDGIVGSGKHVWGPSKDGLPNDGVEACSETYNNLESKNVEMPPSSSKKSKHEIKRESKRQKQNSSEKLADLDSQLMAVLKTLENSDRPSIEDCNKILDNMESLTDFG